MRILAGSESVRAADRGSVLTVGNFDGLHLGHQSLLRSVTETARSSGRPACVYTFDPHPRRVLFPDRAEHLLMTSVQLEAGLEAAGVDLLVREPFTREFARLSAEEFLDRIIGSRLAPSRVFVGEAFHFGKGRAGSAETLQQLAPKLGMRVDVIPQVRVGDGDSSSTRVRRAIAEGDVAEAYRCLGRGYAIWGRVVHGDHRGRTLGFPTANLETANELLPAFGVYAATVRSVVNDRPEGETRAAVANVGTRPTFEPGRVLTEVHLLDFQGDLYGQDLEVCFLERIRPEKKFSGPDELRQQIAADSERARQLLASRAV